MRSLPLSLFLFLVPVVLILFSCIAVCHLTSVSHSKCTKDDYTQCTLSALQSLHRRLSGFCIKSVLIEFQFVPTISPLLAYLQCKRCEWMNKRHKRKPFAQQHKWRNGILKMFAATIDENRAKNKNERNATDAELIDFVAAAATTTTIFIVSVSSSNFFSLAQRPFFVVLCRRVFGYKFWVWDACKNRE